MPRGLRCGRWPALPGLLLCAACATQQPEQDQWGVRRVPGPAPAVVSLSEVNPGRAAASQPLRPVLLRAATRGTNSIAVHVDAPLAVAWLPFAGRIEPELQRALDWLVPVGAGEQRNLHLQVTLVDDDHHRREQRRHPATDTVRVDLLVPTAREPASRSAAVAGALAIALHETVHVLRSDGTDRAADEYRASLVESCYLLDVARAGDVIDLDGGQAAQPQIDGAGVESASDGPAVVESQSVQSGFRGRDPVDAVGDTAPAATGSVTGTGDFTIRHSREAAARVLAELRRAAGTARIGPADIAALRRARAFCHRRLRLPTRR